MRQPAPGAILWETNADGIELAETPSWENMEIPTDRRSVSGATQVCGYGLACISYWHSQANKL